MAGDWRRRRPAGAARAAGAQRRGGPRARPAADDQPRHGASARASAAETACAGRRAQHPLPLRPRQRPLRAVPRRRRWPTRARSSSTRAEPSPTRSRRKYRRICEKLDLGPGDRVLEIGCGWGGFALHAARERGCPRHRASRSRASSTTLARRARARRPGSTDRVAIEYRDYRDVEGTYTHVVSIEMLEAIGEAQFEPYFFAARPRARAGRPRLHPDDRGARPALRAYRRTRDWIQAYIFPGGH